MDNGLQKQIAVFENCSQYDAKSETRYDTLGNVINPINFQKSEEKQKLGLFQTDGIIDLEKGTNIIDDIINASPYDPDMLVELINNTGMLFNLNSGVIDSLKLKTEYEAIRATSLLISSLYPESDISLEDILSYISFLTFKDRGRLFHPGIDKMISETFEKMEWGDFLKTRKNGLLTELAYYKKNHRNVTGYEDTGCGEIPVFENYQKYKFFSSEREQKRRCFVNPSDSDNNLIYIDHTAGDYASYLDQSRQLENLSLPESIDLSLDVKCAAEYMLLTCGYENPYRVFLELIQVCDCPEILELLDDFNAEIQPPSLLEDMEKNRLENFRAIWKKAVTHLSSDEILTIIPAVQNLTRHVVAKHLESHLKNISYMMDEQTLTPVISYHHLIDLLYFSISHTDYPNLCYRHCSECGKTFLDIQDPDKNDEHKKILTDMLLAAKRRKPRDFCSDTCIKRHRFSAFREKKIEEIKKDIRKWLQDHPGVSVDICYDSLKDRDYGNVVLRKKYIKDVMKESNEVET